jgi:membrane protease YdiL (CAAX protease family)
LVDKNNRYIKFKPQKETFIAFSSFLVCVLMNATANTFKGNLFFVFYHCIFGLGICIFFPLLYVGIIRKEPLASIGLTIKGWQKAIMIALAFLAISIPGQFIGKNVSFPSFDKFIYISIPLFMSSLFEEIYFRGFIQTKLEKAFGIIPAVLLSGMFFSLYHLGYPKFRSMELLLTMFLVGVLFAIAFRMTNNVITSFAVNLPNAIAVNILNPQLFEDFSPKIAIHTLPIIALSFILIIFVNRCNQKE